MHYSIYRLDTGHFTGQRFMLQPVDDEAVARLTPAGCAALAGEHDHRAARVDLATGTVVPYTPPVDVARALRDAKAVRLYEIDRQLASLDAQAIRPAGEIAEAMALQAPAPQAAVDRLTAINAAKAAQRTARAAVQAAASAEQLAAIT